ncbi:DMT family transporter [Oceanospirillaceae bacterium]|jgi:drug/metabolite transporter (DMT)-like permease|nr:DMT family transporter [Oceanospirillaceae bacterium]MBT4998558.1 DMT family transporter [Oceanospirillaceae bacterium]MBT5629088.1 DMT family transporter [Oceanospirillaceae bacterium]MBT6100499.1 DMT family transporter [Oceanospirillaceae bacterium]MBT7674074.1 DMT family transporter [Oceanospirillaceae bacterium]
MLAAVNTIMNRREWAMLVTLSVLWGGSFFFAEIALESLPPLTIVTLRVGLAAITLWLVVLALKLPIPNSPPIWIAFFTMGLLNNVLPFSLIVWGQSQISSGLAAILNATAPLFGVIVAGILLRDESATPLKITGVVIGFAGVIVMMDLSSIATSSLLAQLAILAAALSYACASVYGRRFKATGLNPILVAAGQVTGSTLLLLPIALWVDGNDHYANVPSQVWAAIISLAVFSTAAAYILYFKLLASAGATNILLVTLLVPVSAILLGWLFLEESLQTPHIIGMAMIALGLSAIDGRLWRRASET